MGSAPISGGGEVVWSLLGLLFVECFINGLRFTSGRKILAFFSRGSALQLSVHLESVIW